MQNQAEEHHRLHIEKSHSRSPLSNTQEKISSPLTSSPTTVRSVVALSTSHRSVRELGVTVSAKSRTKPDRDNRRIRTVVSSVTFRKNRNRTLARPEMALPILPQWLCPLDDHTVDDSWLFYPSCIVVVVVVVGTILSCTAMLV